MPDATEHRCRLCTDGFNGIPKPLRRLYSRFGPMGVSTVSISTCGARRLCPLDQSETFAADFSTHRAETRAMRRIARAILSIGVMDWVATQNGMPCAAAAFANCTSPSYQASPATAVGAITKGDGCRFPNSEIDWSRVETSTSARGRQPDLVERAAVIPDRKLIFGAAIDIFEQNARQLPARAKARVLDVQDRRNCHRLILCGAPRLAPANALGDRELRGELGAQFRHQRRRRARPAAPACAAHRRRSCPCTAFIGPGLVSAKAMFMSGIRRRCMASASAVRPASRRAQRSAATLCGSRFAVTTMPPRAPAATCSGNKLSSPLSTAKFLSTPATTWRK